MDSEPQQLTVVDDVHAFVQVRPDAESPELHERPLGGMSLAVKDNIQVRGLAFTAGHPLFAGRVAEQDAEAVVRMRNGGARVLGVTRTDAGGFGVMTPDVKNPVAPGRTVGGSSGGSAAAVAAGLADLGLGTDTGGSARIPAACCGIHGYKPSWSDELLEGTWPLAPEMDHVGIMAATLEATQAAGEVLVGQALSRAPGELVLGVDGRWLQACDAPVQQAFGTAMARLKKAGLEIRDVDLPPVVEVGRVHGTLVLASARQLYASVWPEEEARLGKAAGFALRAAAALNEESIQGAREQREEIRTRIRGLFEQVDVVLAPTLAARPPRSDAFRLRINGKEHSTTLVLTWFTCLANLVGMPALTAPLLADSIQGFPQGLQFMAGVGRDALVFEAATRVTDILRDH